MLDRRGRLLLTTLAFCALRGTATEIETLRRWLDSWLGIGAVERDVTERTPSPSTAYDARR